MTEQDLRLIIKNQSDVIDILKERLDDKIRLIKKMENEIKAMYIMFVKED